MTTSTFARVNLHVRLLLIAFAWLSCEYSSALSIETSEGQLSRNGLPLDAPILTQYLTDGIPTDLSPPGENASRSAKFRIEKWKLYKSIAAYLGETTASEAIPVLVNLISDDLPQPLQHDLDVHVVGYSGHSTTDEWDFARKRETATLRAACADALARLNDTTALPILIHYLDRLNVEVDLELEKENPDSAFMWAYSRTCLAIAALGANDGIQATIDRLDQCPVRGPETLLYYLRIATGQQSGPVYDQPLHTRPAEIEKWKTWWMANKNSFKPNRTHLLKPSHLQRAPSRPHPRTLQQYVAEAESRYQDYDGTGHGTVAVAWLESNGIQNIAGLLGIVEDRNQRSRVRGEALAWYAKFAGEDAYDLLNELATSSRPYELQIESVHIQTKALKLLEERFPNRVEDIAREILSKGGLAGGVLGDNAVYILARNPDNLSDLAKNFDSVDVKLQVIQKLVSAKQLISPEVFSKAIQGNDMLVAAYGYTGARKWKLLDNLDTETTVALERWKSNPVFQVTLFNREAYDGSALEFCREILSGMSETGVQEAKAYRNLYVWLASSGKRHPELKNEPEATDALISDVWEGFMRCVDSYQLNAL